MKLLKRTHFEQEKNVIFLTEYEIIIENKILEDFL